MASHADCEVIVVHGVGAPAPGSTLDASLQGLSSGATHAFQREDVVVDGVAFARALGMSDGAPFAVTEVNWADLLRPGAGVAGTLRHSAMLALAMLDGAASLSRGPWLIKVYQWLFESIFLWCVWPAIACLIVATVRPRGVALGVLAALLVALGASAVSLVKYSPMTKVAAPVWAVVSLLFAFGTSAAPGPWVETSAWLYGWSQVLAVIALFAAAASEVVGVLWSRRITPLLGRLALLYVPAVLASSLGSVLWVTALWAVPHGIDFQKWGARFSYGLGYDLQQVEFVVAGVVFVLGVIALALVLAVAALSFFEFRGRRLWFRSGGLANASIGGLLAIAPVALIGASGVFLHSFLEGTSEKSLIDGTSILETYQYSALRLLPYLVAVLTPLGVVMDVLGDVGFYLATRRNLDIGVEARKRLTQALGVARRSSKQIVVVAHSQGSVIAYDAVADGPSIDRLVSIGSPISTLYARFIGRTFKSIEPTAWVNAFRLGDYIGGPNASAGATDVPLGPGGHTSYFDDPETWKVEMRRPLTSSPAAHPAQDR